MFISPVLNGGLYENLGDSKSSKDHETIFSILANHNNVII